MTFQIKKGDTAPALEAKLVDEDGSSAALSLAENVVFYMDRKDDNETILEADLDSGVRILDESKGKVQYSWDKGDTDKTGYKNAEFEVVFTTGEVKTYPNNYFIRVNVNPVVEH